MTEDATAEPLFYEQGASWYWLLAGPIGAAIMLWVDLHYHVKPAWVVPLFVIVLISGPLTIQIKAARIHASVELTEHTLREGTESINVDNIALVYPEPETGPDATPPKWKSTRSLGELDGVPRGRTAIGLKLGDGRTVQGWARNDKELRAALTELVEQRRPTS